MTTEFAPVGYERTLDRIVSAFAKAPNFIIGGRKFSTDEVFEDILYGVDTVKDKTKSAERLLVIEQVISKLHEAKIALEAKDEHIGITALADAKELFRSIKSLSNK